MESTKPKNSTRPVKGGDESRRPETGKDKKRPEKGELQKVATGHVSESSCSAASVAGQPDEQNAAGGNARRRRPAKGKEKEKTAMRDSDSEFFSVASSQRGVPSRTRTRAETRRKKTRRIVSDGSTSSSSAAEERRKTVIAQTSPRDSAAAATLEVESAASAAESKRARGRPPTTGEYVGLAAAKQALVEAQRAELELRTEKEVVERAQQMVLARERRQRPVAALAGQAPLDVRAEHAQGLQQQIAVSLEVVSGVSRVSKGLKGTLQKALKDSVAFLQEATEELLSRTATKEVELLRAANRRLEVEIADLRNEVASLRSEVTTQRNGPAIPAPPPQPTTSAVDTALAANLDHLIEMVENRFAALEERLSLLQQAQLSGVVRTPRPTHSDRPAPTLRPSTSSRLSEREYPPLPPSPRTSSALPAAATAEKSWSTVTRRKPRKARPNQSTEPGPAAEPSGVRGKKKKKGGKKKKGKRTGAQEPPHPPSGGKDVAKKKVRQAPRVRPPHTTAVILDLQPGAAERGVTLESLLTKARASIRLADLGIEGGVGLKTARTGARILLVPGSTSAPKADALAERIRDVLGAEDVKVSRPEKTVGLRVSGLDDCTTPAEVVAAIVETTNCAAEHVRVHGIYRGRDGLGASVVACPVAAANKLLRKRRKLLVGWASATVRPLKPRAERCFRCHEIGHVVAKCTSKVDRSRFCLRCGQPRHEGTAPCTAKPHCNICEAAGRRANHIFGNGPCGPQSTGSQKKKEKEKKKGSARAATGKPVQSQSSRPQEGAGGSTK